MSTQRINKLSIIVFILFLAYLFGKSSNVYAQDNNTVSVTLPVQQIFEVANGEKVDSKFNYRLVSMEPENPMPIGSANTGYIFSLEGNESFDTEPISFSSTGTYTYQMEQVIEDQISGYTYDKEVYYITIYINNSSEGLSAQVIVKNSSDYKVDALKFTNTYSDPSKFIPQKVQNVKTGEFTNYIYMFFLFSLASIILLITTRKKRIK